MDSFYKKNALGVNIQYDIIGYFTGDDGEYRIYTDYTTADTPLGINLFVDIKKDTGYEAISSSKQEIVLAQFNSEILNQLLG